MHGTADDFSENTRVGLARQFETALRAGKLPVESAYCDGCGHNSFFTDAATRGAELRRMIEFLRGRLSSD